MKLKLIKEGIDDVINYNAGAPAGGVYGRTQDRYKSEKDRLMDDSWYRLKNMYYDEFNKILKDYKLSNWRDGQWLKWYYEDKDLAEKFLDKLSELTDGKVTKDNFKITRKFIELIDNNNYTLNDLEDLIKLIKKSGKLSDKINQEIDDKVRKDTIGSLKDKVDYLKNNDLNKSLDDYLNKLANAVKDVLTNKFKVETEVTTHLDPRWDDESSKDDTLKLSKSKYEGPFRVNMRTRKDYDDRMNKLLKKLFSGRQIATLDLDDVGNIKKINFDYSQLEKIPDELKKALGNESLNENRITNELPGSLDNDLQDISQMIGGIDYGDIFNLAKVWNDLSRKDKSDFRKLVTECSGLAEEGDEEAAKSEAEYIKVMIDKFTKIGNNMKNESKMTEGKFTDLILDIAAKASKDPAMFEKVAHEMFSDEQRKGLTKNNLESRLLAKVNRGEVDPNDLRKFVESKVNEDSKNTYLTEDNLKVLSDNFSDNNDYKLQLVKFSDNFDIPKARYTEEVFGDLDQPVMKTFDRNSRVTFTATKDKPYLVVKYAGSPIYPTYYISGDRNRWYCLDSDQYYDLNDYISSSKDLNESKKSEAWNEIKVHSVKDILNRALSILDDYDDNDTVICEPNTYGLGTFLGIPNTGYIDLDHMNIESEYDREEESKKVSESLTGIFSRVSTKSESFTYKK